jgi:site-specific DNA-methyltransferase (adenine-specific)
VSRVDPLPGEPGPAAEAPAAEASAAEASAVAAVLERRRSGAIVLGDNLEVLGRLPTGVADLVYIDPPFATGRSRRLASIRTGRGTSTRRGFGDRSYRYEVVSDFAYDDDLPLDAHLEELETRLVELRRVLAPSGSIYVHVDWRTVHHVRLLLDRVFGPERFLNEIVWAYDYGGRARDRWARKHDTLLWYAKGARWTFERESIDRVPYLAPGLVGPEKAALGKLPTDVWWMTIVPPGSRERTGYPTQKPLRLLERVVRASSKPGDLVLDAYAGSGTTGVAALRLDRRYLLIDRHPDAVAIAGRRIADVKAGAGLPEAMPADQVPADGGPGDDGPPGAGPPDGGPPA